ncbi:TPA: hypothetical protein ACGO3H_000974 [Streptococcus suis]
MSIRDVIKEIIIIIEVNLPIFFSFLEALDKFELAKGYLQKLCRLIKKKNDNIKADEATAPIKEKNDETKTDCNYSYTIYTENCQVDKRLQLTNVYLEQATNLITALDSKILDVISLESSSNNENNTNMEKLQEKSPPADAEEH